MTRPWPLQVRRLHAGKFTITDQQKWKEACAVLQDLARHRGLYVAKSHNEKNHMLRKVMVCENCSNKVCSETFVVWKISVVEYGAITIPLTLNGAVGLCSSSKHFVFSVRGVPLLETKAFCRDLEAVVGFLFPGKFRGDLRNDLPYDLADDDGSKLDEQLPAEFASRIRAIKMSVPRLSSLCYTTLEEAAGTMEAKKALRDFELGDM